MNILLEVKNLKKSFARKGAAPLEALKGINLQLFEGEIISIPVQSSNTTMECINPTYVTDVNLIKEHTDKMNKLHELLQYQLEIGRAHV